MIQAIGPPLLKTRAVPDPAFSAVRRSEDPTRSVKAPNDSAYSSSCSPPVQRSVAASNHSWNSALVGLSPAKDEGSFPSMETWSNSSQPASVSDDGAPASSPRHASAVSRCRRMPPTITRSGVTPRAASALPSSRDCSHPVSERTS